MHGPEQPPHIPQDPDHLNPASPRKVRPSALPPVLSIPATFANPLQNCSLLIMVLAYQPHLADANPPALGISARRHSVVFQKLIASPCFHVSLCSFLFPSSIYMSLYDIEMAIN